MNPRGKFILVLLLAAFLAFAAAFGVTVFVRSRSAASSVSKVSLPTAATPSFSSSTSQSACPVRPAEMTVTGTSLSGFISPGAKVTVLDGYYACHEPERNDVVIYLYGGAAANDPVIKIVKGVPGDKVSFGKAGGSWNILVNGEPLRTTTGIPYAITGEIFDIFSRYVNEAKGVVPSGEYLLLGNLPAGSIDSTRFGFVPKDGLVGKVIEN